MTNEQILKKAIEKAVKNGWELVEDEEWYVKTNGIYFTRSDQEFPDEYSINDIIFSHDFAKAFWNDPNDWCCDEDDKNGEHYKNKSEHCLKEVWKWNLREMVLEEYPIKYLEKYL